MRTLQAVQTHWGMEERRRAVQIWRTQGGTEGKGRNVFVVSKLLFLTQWCEKPSVTAGSSHCVLGTDPAAWNTARAAADLLSKPVPAAGGCTELRGISVTGGGLCFQ